MSDLRKCMHKYVHTYNSAIAIVCKCANACASICLSAQVRRCASRPTCASEQVLTQVRKCANSLLAQVKHVVIPANTERRSNVVLMLGQRSRQWYYIQPTEIETIKSMWSLPFECVSILRTNVYLYKSTKAQWGLLKFEVSNLKCEI